ncbi:MAG: adenosine deaminase [Leptospiraceae bacterium]|nr:adenosine deaminase [Leptospiraceae bacterium]
MEEKKQRILVLCKGFQEGEDKSNGKIRARLAMSLQRESGYEEDYNLLKYLQKENPLIQKYLVAIDFCHVEEGYPPSDKKDFFRIVLDDNKKNPASALAILYHVAESFTDKTPSSAVRWVIEAAEYGAHRLGHCLALGLEAQSFHNITFQESVKERLAQLEFLLSRHEDIAKFGYIPTEENLEKEIQELQKHKPEEKLSLYFNEERVSELHSIQEYGMRVLKDRKTVIESCPTSNLFIGMIDNVEKLPLKRFLENSLSVSIGTDDPGIFDTNIENEFTYLKQIGFSEKHQELRKCSFAYRSEVLSGRI